MKKEVEILYSIEKGTTKKEIEKKLAGFQFRCSSETVDVYFFDPKKHNFKPDHHGRLSECSRVRLKGKMSFLTYKKDYFDKNNVWQYSDEYETAVEDFLKTVQIMLGHGMKELVQVKSIKHVYENAKYEIIFEDVTDLGYFLEIEVKKNVAVEDIDREKEGIRSFAKKIGIPLSEELNAGKPELLLRKNIKKQAFISYKFSSARDSEMLRKKLNNIKKALKKIGFENYCSIDEAEYFDKKKMTDKEIIIHINDKIDDSNLFVLFIDDKAESKGMMIEIGYALSQNKKIVLIIKKGLEAKLERDIANFIVEFSNPEEIVSKLEEIELV